MGDMVEQMSLWGEIYPFYHINKKLRVIEMFGGVGSQIAACNILFNGDKTKFEQYKLVEWCYQSYSAYNSIHVQDFKDYAEGKTKEEIIARIIGTSTDCETPLSIEQLNKKPMEWLKSAYNNCEATHNLINIMNVHGKDLEINDTDKYDYLLFYSFPCQDISMAGKMQGVKEGTRSGLLLEVERILDELKAMSDEEGVNHLPSVLILENVEALCNKLHIKALQSWQHKLETLGYHSYCEILNGVNYGIPQTRKRTFLVSLLGEYAYDFPRKVKAKYKLKHFLEKDVAEKYYLSKEQIERIANWKAQQKPLENIDKHIDTCPTITARGAGEDHSGMILIDEDLFEEGEIVDFDSSDAFQREHNAEECPSLVCHPKFGVVHKGIPIKNNNSRGYSIAEDGDGVDISGRMEYHRGTVQKGKSQTLTTKGGENVGVCIKEESLFSDSELALITPEGDLRRYIDSDIVDEFKEGQVGTTTFPNGYGHGPRTHDDCITLNTVDRPIVKQNLRIRKLTELECWKLMGFTKTNFKAMERNHFPQSELYRMAGDSIIVCCIIALLSPLVYDQDTHIKIINNYIERIVNGE